MQNKCQESAMLPLWIEVSRHLRLAESLPVFIGTLLDNIPMSRLRIDLALPDHSHLQTVAEWRIGIGINVSHRDCEYTLSDLEKFDAEIKGQGGHLSEPNQSVNISGDKASLVAPVILEKKPAGLVHFVGTSPAAYTSNQHNFIGATLDPLSRLIENDQRLTEIQHLRATAEADRKSLLDRLGRKHPAEDIIGVNGGLHHVIQRVIQVAPTIASVLILGETGSGKEVIARAIHERSARHDGPFVRVNCGALPPELIDSELFGHEKGSFTGAHAVHRGWFERADGGTLFLDEIGELPKAAQVRLLRILQDGILQRVGSESDLHVDVRIIAATHRDLPQMVQEGKFREDLWYRIGVFPIILPPLRERTEDIEPLAQYFIKRAAQRLGIHTPSLTDKDMECLLDYSWPGNVRELISVLERAVILGQGDRLDLDIALGVHNTRVEEIKASAGTESELGFNSDIMSLDNIICAHLKRALYKTQGRVDGRRGAARLLGLNTSTLRAKLRKFNIDPAQFRNSV